MEIDDVEEENGKENALNIREGDGERETGDAAPFGSDDEVLDERGGEWDCGAYRLPDLWCNLVCLAFCFRHFLVTSHSSLASVLNQDQAFLYF